ELDNERRKLQLFLERCDRDRRDLSMDHVRLRPVLIPAPTADTAARDHESQQNNDRRQDGMASPEEHYPRKAALQPVRWFPGKLAKDRPKNFPDPSRQPGERANHQPEKIEHIGCVLFGAD